MQTNPQVKYSDAFIDFVRKGVDQNYYLGTGKPNAKILIVGQESAIEEKEGWYNDNANEWENQIANEQNFTDFKRERIFSEGHTWNKYQKLHNYIFPDQISDTHINFEERFFTTEMSDNPAKRNLDARKKENFTTHLKNRKNTFFKEKFIEDFPVVILACSDYIQNND